MPGLGQRLGVPESNALAATVLPGMGWGGRYNALAASAGELAERAALAFPTDAEAMAYRTLRARRGILPSGEEEQLAENYQSKMMQLALAGLTVWHGSPHKFDKFDSTKIGSGEGAQAYGHGLYLAENPGVAKGYQGAGMLHDKAVKVGDRWVQSRGTVGSAATVDDYMADALIRFDGNTTKAKRWLANNPGPYDTEAIKRIQEAFPSGGIAEMQKAGNIYKVDLPDEQMAKMLDWDKPLSQQPESVRKALLDADLPTLLRFKWGDRVKPDSATGQQIYEAMTMKVPDRYPLKEQQSGASQTLRSIGIPGIKYLDQGSRTAGRWTRQDVKDAFKEWRAKVGQPEEQAAFEIWREMKRAHRANPATRNFVVFPGNENLLKILERQ